MTYEVIESMNSQIIAWYTCALFFALRGATANGIHSVITCDPMPIIFIAIAGVFAVAT